MKGITKLQLFDAKTKKLVHESVEENTVTTALSQLFSLNSDADLAKPHAYVASNLFRNNICNKTPIATKLLGGVLLFSNQISASYSYPDMLGAEALGNAGSAYSGIVPSRGTYNAAESGMLTDVNNNPTGYRFVWDFGTDKCNGTIASVCMTSVRGGNTGYTGVIERQTNSLSSPGFAVPAFDYNSFSGASTTGYFTIKTSESDANPSTVVNGPIIGTAGYPAGKILKATSANQGRFNFVFRRTQAGEIVYQSLRTPWLNALGLNDKFSTLDEGLTPSYYPTLKGTDKLSSTDKLAYFDDYSFYTMTGPDPFNFNQPSFQSLVPETTTTVRFRSWTADDPPVLQDNILYTLSSPLYGSGADASFPLFLKSSTAGGTVYIYGLLAGATETESYVGKFNTSGTLLESIPFHSVPSGSSITTTPLTGWSANYSAALKTIVLTNQNLVNNTSLVDYYNSMIFMGDHFIKASFPYMLSESSDTAANRMVAAPSTGSGVYNTNIIYDYCYPAIPSLNFESNHQSGIGILAYPYLATVNNLSSSVTKSSLNTLKITYDLLG